MGAEGPGAEVADEGAGILGEGAVVGPAEEDWERVSTCLRALWMCWGRLLFRGLMSVWRTSPCFWAQVSLRASRFPSRKRTHVSTNM